MVQVYADKLVVGSVKMQFIVPVSIKLIYICKNEEGLCVIPNYKY